MPQSRLFLRLIILAPLMVLCSACSEYGHQQYRKGWAPPQGESSYSLAFVEFNDKGRFWDDQNAQDSQYKKALDLVLQTADQGNTVVLVFVHGWHHNASCCDDNVECFEATLASLHALLNQQDYVDARLKMGVSPEINLVGIYVGWRGRSLPSFFDYLTFWGRKEAAHTVGSGDLRHFLLELDEIYQSRRKSTDRFLGLVTIGHSFGGHAVLSAVAPTLEERLLSRKANQVASGFGDLVVLVNPAVEAAAYDKIFVTYRESKFPAQQRPLLFAVSSKGDFSVRKLFPLGRMLWKPRSDVNRKSLDYIGLGVYEGQVTHDLKWVGPSPSKCPPSSTGRESTCKGRSCDGCSWQGTLDQCQATGENNSLTPSAYLPPDPIILKTDFTGKLTLAGVRLDRLSGPEHSPAIVAVTNDDVIDGHSGIFTRRFSGFLSLYVGYIEGSYFTDFLRRRAQAADAKDVNSEEPNLSAAPDGWRRR